MNNTPPEVIERWRAEFEIFISESSDKCFNTAGENWSARNKAGRYKDRFLQFGFECWQESRQSVRIELPQDLIWEGVDADECMDVSDINAAIESQGYKVNK